MSDQATPPPTPPSQRSGCATVALFVVGVILLLPGLCSLAFMAASIGRIGSGMEPGIVLIMMLCLTIGAIGVVMIVAALRR
jgi:hypothetical protein